MTGLGINLRFHAEALRDYLLCWESADHRAGRGMSEEEAAYHLLEHAGHLDRQGIPPSWAAELAALPPAERRRLVGAACRYTRGMTWAERARRLLALEALSADAFEEVEDLLLRRDALETVWAVARALADDLLAADAELGREVALARCVAAEIDEELARRPDVLSVAAEVLAGLPPLPAAARELDTGWWYAGVRDLARTYEQPLLPRRRVVLSSPSLHFVDDARYALAAAGEGGEQPFHLAADSGEELLLRVFPRDAGGRVYTLALELVPAAREAVVRIDGKEIEAVAPLEYFAPQQLLYLFVTEEVARRLTAPGAHRSVELRERPGPR
jgi:hypothetical protein